MSAKKGFTLIEVLLALAIIAIALTALLKASSQDVNYTQRIKEKTIAHWVGMQGIAMVQLGLLPLQVNEEVSQVTEMLGVSWYWRVKLLPTSVKKMQKIVVVISKNKSGPFTHTLIGYRFNNE
ncbi:general secretion pathway protein I (plasmid) [Legionella adelaidensis]|uniref:Type II secretion system protein I n=1 Tax=Legionella adelaidensis TaxID=45056 RepID=A0A0W0R4A1_9GAMM|nr:type II secretion system minor pseudopilin GspI [Legionella adelaidensis]KTC65850.1 type II secretory pathway protein LspI [Legionella adelaidensis]VEH85280.1 general secretion pathway protein I [Legionella adelaidensis]